MAASETWPDDNGEPNLLCTFEDETGKRFMAAGYLGILVPEDPIHGDERISVESTKDRAMTLVGFKVVTR
jgi:hypothetical protein